MMSTGDCAFCCAPFTSVIRQQVPCVSPQCETASNNDKNYCTECLRKYVLEYAHEEPHCPNCKTRFDLSYLENVLGSGFVNGNYAKKARDTALERQKAQLPGTQEDSRVLKNVAFLSDSLGDAICEMTEFQHRYKVLNAKLREIRSKLLEALREYKIDEQIRTTSEVIHVDFINEVVSSLDTNSSQLENVINECIKMCNSIGRGGSSAIESEPPTIVRPCSNGSCRGYLGKNFACLMCNAKYCRKCGCRSKEPHDCDPNEVESEKLKRSTTKTCPNPECGVISEKTEGCDQVWCWRCHKVWSWREHKLLNTTNIHAEDYHRWRNESLADIAPDQVFGDCDQGCALNRLGRVCRDRHGCDMDAHIYSWHIFLERIAGENVDEVDNQEVLFRKQKRLRIRYLNSALDGRQKILSKKFGTMSENDLGKYAYANELEHRNYKLTKELFATFVVMARDILYRHIEDCTSLANNLEQTEVEQWEACYKQTLTRLEAAVNYINARIFERTKAYSAHSFQFIISKEHQTGSIKYPRYETRVSKETLSLANAKKWYMTNVPQKKRQGTEFTLKKRKRD